MSSPHVSHNPVISPSTVSTYSLIASHAPLQSPVISAMATFMAAWNPATHIPNAVLIVSQMNCAALMISAPWSSQNALISIKNLSIASPIAAVISSVVVLMPSQSLLHATDRRTIAATTAKIGDVIITTAATMAAANLVIVGWSAKNLNTAAIAIHNVLNMKIAASTMGIRSANPIWLSLSACVPSLNPSTTCPIIGPMLLNIV